MGLSRGDFGHWDQVKSGYRARWQQRAGASGERWEDVEPSYRFGWDLRHDPRYRDRRAWSEVEAEARHEWTSMHPTTPWASARDNIREAWEGSVR